MTPKYDKISVQSSKWFMSTLTLATCNLNIFLNFMWPIFINMHAVAWLRHYATSWKVAGWNLDEMASFFSLPNPSSHTMALGLTQPLTEMSARNLPRGKGWPACKADNLTAICEPIV
jgi:hypothetical protein